MKEFNYNKERFELETIMNHYTCIFNSKELAPFAYKDLQKINPRFPYIDDERFWDKLNAIFIENCNMDLAKLE